MAFVETKQNILDKVIINENGCWEWKRALDRYGYGKLNRRKNGKRRSLIAHRYVYEFFYGPIGEGMTIDHTCSTRSCVNPNHLESVTGAENLRRAKLHERWDAKSKNL